MSVAPVTVVVDLLLLGLLCLFTTLLNDFDIVVEYGCNDRNHIGFNYPSSYIFSPANSYIHHALEGEVPFPHVHHIFAPTLL